MIGKVTRALARLSPPSYKSLAAGYGGVGALGGGLYLRDALEEAREEEKADTFNMSPGVGPRTSTDPIEARDDYELFEPHSVYSGESDRNPTETHIFDWEDAIKHDLEKLPYGSSHYDREREAALQRAAKRRYDELKGDPGNKSLLPEVNWDKRNDQVRHSSYSNKPLGNAAAGTYYKSFRPFSEEGIIQASRPPEIEHYDNQFHELKGIATHEHGHHMAPATAFFDPRPGAKQSDDWTSKEMRAAMDAATDAGRLDGEFNWHLPKASERWADFAYEKRKLAHGEYPSLGQEVKEGQDSHGYDAVNDWYNDPDNKASKDRLDDYILMEKSMHKPDWQPSDYFNEEVMDNWIRSRGMDSHILRETIKHADPEVDEVGGDDLKRLFPKDYEQLMKLIEISQNNTRPVGMFTGRSAMPA